jgi:6-phosphogluconolactonase
MGAESVVIDRFESPEALARTAAREWLKAVGHSQAEPHCAAFSGGRISVTFFEAIVAEVRQHGTDIAGAHLFWADERCVPPDHPDSNYGVMREALLGPLEVTDAQVHRIKGELGALAAAADASAEYGKVVGRPLDYVFLGMGEDGHVASIFPGDALDEPVSDAYRPIFNAPKPPPERVTLSMRAIVAARNVWVLVSGSGKEEALGKSLSGDPEIPLGKLLKSRESTRIFTTLDRNRS